MKKKFLSMLITATLAFTAVACGSAETEVTDSAEKSVEATNTDNGTDKAATKETST